MATQKLNEATELLKKVKQILEDEELMNSFCKVNEEEIDEYVHHKNIEMKIKDILDEHTTKVIINWGSVEEVIRLEYISNFGNVIDKEQINVENL